ncbi:MAG: hypothetical protein H0X37_24825 [Herpetosiphonaceae bacterium]|nr:hypothetical protein [Herpetosiphonaceae bacterium]
MAVMIKVPDELQEQLQQRAEIEHRSVEEVTLGLLQDALERTELFPTVDDVVARIKAIGPNPDNVRPAQGSLADALRNGMSTAPFDLAQWTSEWAAVETEIRDMR